LSAKKLAQQYRDMGADSAGDYLYELEMDLEKGKITQDDLESKFDQWAQSAAGDMAYSNVEYADPSSEREINFLKKMERIEDVQGWMADEIYEGMVKKLEGRAAELAKRAKKK
jgi:hypothetical protein